MFKNSVSDSPLAPVRHGKTLFKKVLVPSPFSCVRHISHIVLRPGDTAVTHGHADGYEAFYCVRGRLVMEVDGSPVTLEGGGCLIIEPGEAHGITKVEEESELVYFFALKGP